MLASTGAPDPVEVVERERHGRTRHCDQVDDRVVEQPVAIATVTAFVTETGVMIRSGVRSSHTISTIRRPQAALVRWWPESAAGIDEAPGSVSPIASAIAVIVEAVPIVMQCP